MAEVAREQHKARHAKAATEPSEIAREAERARAERAERDRALAQEHKAADKVRERDAGMIVLDHGLAAGSEASATASEDDAYYAQFQVPNDLVW